MAGEKDKRICHELDALEISLVPKPELWRQQSESKCYFSNLVICDKSNASTHSHTVLFRLLP